MPSLSLTGYDSFGVQKPTHGNDTDYFPQGLPLGPLGFFGVQIKRGVTIAGTLAILQALSLSIGNLVYVTNGRKTDEAATKGTGLHGYVASTGPIVIKTLDTNMTVLA